MTIIWDFVTNTMASWQASIPDFANQVYHTFSLYPIND